MPEPPDRDHAAPASLEPGDGSAAPGASGPGGLSPAGGFSSGEDRSWAHGSSSGGESGTAGVSGTIAAPRRVARVVLLDPDDRILLLHGFEPADPSLTWWFTPGGGAEPGESLPDAARRELREETGITEVELGPVIWRRRSTFSFAGQRWANDEWYLLGHTRETDVDMSGRTELELASTTGARWWTLQELRAVADEAREADEVGGPGGAGDAGGCRRSRGGRVQAGGSADPGRWAGSRRPSRFPQELRRPRTGERFFPAELAQLLGTLLESGPPAVPLVLDSQDD